MSDSAEKKPKSAPPVSKAKAKVFDVSKPGKSMPSTTSKPVLVTNRPVLKDPMMLESPTETGDTPTESAPVLKAPTATRIKISPITPGLTVPDPNDDAKPTTAATAPAPEAKPETPAPEPVEKPKGSKSEPTIATLVAAAAKAEDKDTTAVPALDTAAADEEPEPAPTAAAADAATTPAAPEPAPEPAPTVESSAVTPDESAADTPEVQPGSSIPETTDAANTLPNDQQNADALDQAALEAEVARAAELQEIADSHKYYLPINQVEQRRAKRYSWAGVLLAILLGLVWLDVALDAGIVTLPGVKAVTHFFGS